VLEGEGAREADGNGWRLEGGRLTRRSKVGERPDGRAPPVSDRPKKKRGGVCWAGGVAKLGQLGPAYACGRKQAVGLG
jgi:hypothetical protein